MIDTKAIALALATLLLASPVGVPAAHAAGAAVEGETSGKLPTDGEVRHAMFEIRDLVAAALPAIRDGKFGAEDFRRLGDGISDHLQQVAANNRLPTDVRAKLIAILAPLDAAARNLKVEGERSLAAVLAALEDYGRAVDHSGWSGTKEKNP